MLSLYEPLRNEYAYNGETHSIDLAFDNDEQTIWHSAWDGSGIGQPVNIQLSEASQLVGFEYVPRQSGVNGRIK